MPGTPKGVGPGLCGLPREHPTGEVRRISLPGNSVNKQLCLERIMNLIRNGLGMRKGGDRRGAGQPENPHSNTVFTQVHNTL